MQGRVHRSRFEDDCADDSVTVTEYVGDLINFYDQFDGDRGALLDELNDPSNEDFEHLVDQRDISVDGGQTSRRFLTVEPVPGRGVVAFDFFIPSENSNGFAGDDRPEEGTDILRDDLPLNQSRVMIVIDFKTGRGVIVQSETHLDLPGGIDWANEPRPISLNGDRGAWDNMGGIDLDETNQIDLSSNADGFHADWDILNSISPFAISVDGDVDFDGGRGRLPPQRRLRQPGPRRPLPADPGLAVPARRAGARDRPQRLPGRAQPGAGRAAALRPAGRAGPAHDRDRRLSRRGSPQPPERSLGARSLLMRQSLSGAPRGALRPCRGGQVAERDDAEPERRDDPPARPGGDSTEYGHAERDSRPAGWSSPPPRRRPPARAACRRPRCARSAD